MQTKREALAKAGLAIAGARGKFSTKANEWLDAQRAAGVKFSDDTAPVKAVKPPNVKPTGGETEKSSTEKSAGISDYLFPSDFCWPESDYRAFARVGGKKVYHGMREVCNNCRVSLVMCACGAPTIHGSIAIEFERR